MEQSSQDRNLPASERKLEKARKDGQVSRSRDLGHLAVLGTGALSLMALGPVMFDRLRVLLQQQLSFDVQTVNDPTVMLNRLQDMAAAALVGCVIFAAITTVAVLISSVAAGGWVTSLKPITPDFSRLNPLTGLGRMFTKEKFTEVLKMSFIAAALIALGSTYLSSTMHSLAMLVLQPSRAALPMLTEWLSSGMALLLVVILLVAMVDVPLQGFLHKSRMKMSHQEMKQEHKESDGNPQMKGKLRQRQREISQGNSIGAVPKADFVLMNPTHFAVAIRYDDKTMRAPQVVSKGADLLAMKIRDIAKSHSIPVLQSPMLARALYANAELDQDIPASLYTAVAQVLAYIYRLKAALRGDGPMPGEAPQPFVPPELDPQSKVVANASAA
ncbi:MAG: EscU/YscU/HrcU family type III secretion system export apparatus switch protein [Gammaproteobacteria bacterium]|uniref:EscU/YscU/HrcU family type III secretion system export apparatus switch protein n=1 Tax=Rhodoferax sp. TaxID=50421 RepID=UPI0018394A14|nr:EscU/YscU/HrcU family type III secretion system export apparatus switch protein [Rhodoferax sp.]MBU3899271.1 EscU/YscU/HrcU family type III secretion system export apparatus switch protein [Gammaproteobacteria bacterium]MBA3058152.1 EscU/YscU/HrcU family type III secretion system export apparatus switch protein [Rhodoferax sp.]MBU3996927.1 EscU/YscU/HrcU family type III secretion system export apparatus switch protein [Gammaproteobacteria bacterium]MBU4081247.1 EscU/YscU/HrcU family type III